LSLKLLLPVLVQFHQWELNRLSLPGYAAKEGRYREEKKSDESTDPVGPKEFEPMKRRDHPMEINIPEGIDPTVLGASDSFQSLWQESDWENCWKCFSRVV